MTHKTKKKPAGKSPAPVPTRRDDLLNIHPDNIIIRPGWNPKWDENGCPREEIVTMVNMIKAAGVKDGEKWKEAGRITDPIRVKAEKEWTGTPKRLKKTGRYILVHGERRTMAAKFIWDEVTKGILPKNVWGEFLVPCTCVPDGYSELQELMENYTGNNTSIPIRGIQEALFIKKLLDGFEQEGGEFVKMTDREIAAYIGKSIVHVRDTQLLLQAPDEVQQMVKDGKVAPTTIIDAMKEYKDPETMKEKIMEAASVAEESGSETVTAKHLDKVEKRVNSLSLLKKVIKRVQNNELSIPKEHKPLFDFLVKTFDGKLSAVEIEIFITNQLSIVFPHVHESQEAYEEYIADLTERDMVEEVRITGNGKSLLGRQLAGYARKHWKEDFVDEDTSEVVTIDRSEVVIDAGQVLNAEQIERLIDNDVKSVLLHK